MLLSSHLWFHQAEVPPEQRNHAACGNPGFGYARRKWRQVPDPSEDPQRTLRLCKDVCIVREDAQVFRQQSEEDERMFGEVFGDSERCLETAVLGCGCPSLKGSSVKEKLNRAPEKSHKTSTQRPSYWWRPQGVHWTVIFSHQPAANRARPLPLFYFSFLHDVS